MRVIAIRTMSCLVAIALLATGCSSTRVVAGIGSAETTSRHYSPHPKPTVPTSVCQIIPKNGSSDPGAIILIPQSRDISAGLVDCATYDGKTYTVTYRRVSYYCPAGLTCPPDLEPVPNEYKLPDGNTLDWVSDAHPRTYLVKQGERVTLAQLCKRYPAFAAGIFYFSKQHPHTAFPTNKLLPAGAVVYVG